MRLVLDSSSGIALFRSEEGAAVVNELIRDRRSDCSITCLNACELYYDCERRSTRKSADRVLEVLLSLGIEIIDELEPKVWKLAAHLKAKYCRLSLADAIGVAYARNIGGIFVTSDHKELDPLAKDNVCRFLFFR
jgi:predicted nucleic acid-binding protein